MARRKRTPLQIAKDKAWAACSKFVRINEADEDGNCTCVTCGRVYPWKKVQAGHWINGRNNAVLFMEDGIHPQCYGCNVRKQSNPIRYWLWMEEHIGRDRMNQMIARMDWTVEYELDDYLNYEREFTHRAAKIAEQKNIPLKAPAKKKASKKI